jgi:hypothetical protein
MKKSEYIKPVARNLDAVQPVQGSCYSGNIEYTVTDTCDPTGAVALQTCGGGTIVLPIASCQPTGSSAGMSCFDGTSAG